MSLSKTILIVASPFLLTAPVQAGLMSVSSAAPGVNGADIAMLNITGSFDTGGDQGHIWSNRPIMGQTFTTLGNAGGYELTSVTLRNRSNNEAANSATWTIRVGTVTGTTFSPLATETSNNTIGYTGGDYLTFSFDTPVPLAANTVYGFDWDTDGRGFITDNNTDGNYGGGTNFASGANGVPDDNNLVFPEDDRVFHVNLLAVPEPTTVVLLGMGLAACFARRRLRRA